MSVITDESLKQRILSVLIWSSETVEANAECLKESCTDSRGRWEDHHDCENYRIEMEKVGEMNDLIEIINRN